MANSLFYSEKSLQLGVHIGVLILRVLIGLLFVSAGYTLLFTGQAEIFLAPELTKMGFPAPIFFAYLASITEFLGGIALALGFFHRLASLGLIVTMGVAVWFHIFNEDPFIIAILLPLSMGFIFIGLLFTGPGRWSLDAKIFNP